MRLCRFLSVVMVLVAALVAASASAGCGILPCHYDLDGDGRFSDQEVLEQAGTFLVPGLVPAQCPEAWLDLVERLGDDFSQFIADLREASPDGPGG